MSSASDPSSEEVISVAWAPLLLGQATPEEIAEALPAEVALPAASRGQGHRASLRTRAMRPALRVFAVCVTIVTVAGLALGTAAALAGEPDRQMLIRLALMGLVACGLWTQAQGLYRMVVPRRFAPARTADGELSHLLLGQASVSAVAEAAAEMPVVHLRGSSATARWAASGSWFALAAGVIAILAVALAGILANLVRLTIGGRLTSVSGGFSVAMAGLVGFGLWATTRSLLRSIENSRLRRRKRALQRLLRALLNWLLRGPRSRRLLPANGLVQVGGLCVLAVVAIGAGVVPVLSADGPNGKPPPAVTNDETPVRTSTPTATPTPRPATGTTTPVGSGGTSAPQAVGSETPGAGGGGAGQPAGGSTVRPPTSTAGNAPTGTTSPGQVATPAPTPPGTTATPTRTSTPSPTATRTSTPVPFSTIVPPTATPPAIPTATKTSIPTIAPTLPPAPTATPTAPPTPSPTPTPQGCSLANSAADCDADGVPNGTEFLYGSNPSNPGSTPEHLNWSDSCVDGKDNDLDGKTDWTGNDEGCAGIII